jgi:phytoene dehydrogenase-like protein
VERTADIVVLGGGVGGLTAAARLALAGRKPLLLEATDRLGGRFSTIEKDGYKLPTGAVAIETVGPFWDTFGELGIDPQLSVPDPPVMIHVRGRDLRPGQAVWQHMIKRVTKSAGRLAEGITQQRESDPDSQLTLEQWVRRYTRSKTLQSLFQSLAASIFTVNADELPAGAFFRLLRETGGYKTFGYAPQGNVVLADAIAAAVEARGGVVERGTTAIGVELHDGRAVAVHARDAGGEDQRIECAGVVSNLGPRNTAKLAAGSEVEGAFAERIRDVQTTSMLALAFSSDHEIVPHPGIWAFTDTERLCNMANLSATCPDLAPPGRTLYEAYGAPRPSVGGVFDAEAERKLLEADLSKMVPGFDESEVVLFKVMAGDTTPAQQCRPGFDPDVKTPVPNLVEVGDGVKAYGWIGTTACAETASRAVPALLEDLAAAPARSEVAR